MDALAHAIESFVSSEANPISESLALVDQVINECEQRFGNQADILVHPALGPLTAREWRKFHCVHTLHHMRQIKRLRLLSKSVSAPNQRQ